MPNTGVKSRKVRPSFGWQGFAELDCFANESGLSPIGSGTDKDVMLSDARGKGKVMNDTIDFLARMVFLTGNIGSDISVKDISVVVVLGVFPPVNTPLPHLKEPGPYPLLQSLLPKPHRFPDHIHPDH